MHEFHIMYADACTFALLVSHY